MHKENQIPVMGDFCSSQFVVLLDKSNSTRRRRESQDWVQSGEGLSGTSPELWLKEKIFVNAHINISR